MKATSRAALPACIVIIAGTTTTQTAIRLHRFRKLVTASKSLNCHDRSGSAQPIYLQIYQLAPGMK